MKSSIKVVYEAIKEYISTYYELSINNYKRINNRIHEKNDKRLNIKVFSIDTHFMCFTYHKQDYCYYIDTQHLHKFNSETLEVEKLYLY